jgi:serine/threonine-protein kinase
MPEVVRANSQWTIRTEEPVKRTLAPQAVEGAVTRLCWVCILCAVVVTISLFLQRRLQPEIRDLLEVPAIAVTWLIVVLISLGVALIRRFRLLSPLVILNLGLIFEVFVAFSISFTETALPMFPDQPVLGVSKVALWIAVVGLLIPNKPGTKLVAALASASMWPLAYYLNLQLYGHEPLPLNRLVIWMHVPFIMAFATFAISKRIYNMERDAQQARDLGSYKLVSLIGSGGMGEVWRARHHMLARDAAIKLIRSDLGAGQPGYQPEITRKRFKREAQAIASLQSPHTVYLFDFGISQEGSFYYVMELLDGISLEVLVGKFGPQQAPRVVHILRQACESLEEAHRRGLVHRDIKPSNIFACNVGIEYDFVKVLDFGLVKDVSSQETLHLTFEGVSAGTPAYMAPEIAMGENDIDGRVDIYGLGCIAYFLLTGLPVFEEKTATAMALAHVQKAPVPPSQRSEIQIAARLEEAILRCLAKRPEDRPQSARELNDLLAAAGVPEWTQEKASEWWQTYLPESSSYRMARQTRAAEPVLLQET